MDRVWDRTTNETEREGGGWTRTRTSDVVTTSIDTNMNQKEKRGAPVYSGHTVHSQVRLQLIQQILLKLNYLRKASTRRNSLLIRIRRTTGKWTLGSRGFSRQHWLLERHRFSRRIFSSYLQDLRYFLFKINGAGIFILSPGVLGAAGGKCLSPILQPGRERQIASSIFRPFNLSAEEKGVYISGLVSRSCPAGKFPVCAAAAIVNEVVCVCIRWEKW